MEAFEGAAQEGFRVDVSSLADTNEPEWAHTIFQGLFGVDASI